MFLRGQRHWISYYVNGKNYREPGCTGCGGTDPRRCAAAVRALRARRREIARDSFVAPQQERVSAGALLDEYWAARELAGVKSCDRALSQLRRVRGFFGGVRACDLTTAGLERWAKERIAEGYAPATVLQWLATLRAALRLALKRGALSRIPVFPTIAVDNARQGFFEKWEFDKIVAELDEDLADFVRGDYLLGWRKGELKGLRWSSVDRAAGVLRLPDSKNGEGRVIPLRDPDSGELLELGALIERRWRKRAVGTTLVPWVFHRGGRPIGDFRKSWLAACVKAGFARQKKTDASGAPLVDSKGRPVMIATKLIHDFRRTVARDLVEAGNDYKTAMEIGGWKTTHVFLRYRIVDTRTAARALAKTSAHRAASIHNVTDITRTAPMNRDKTGTTAHGHA